MARIACASAVVLPNPAPATTTVTGVSNRPDSASRTRPRTISACNGDGGTGVRRPSADVNSSRTEHEPTETAARSPADWPTGNGAVTALPDALGRERPNHEPSLTNAIGVVDQQPGARRSSAGVAPCLGTFVLGSVAQGAPFVLVAAALERRGVEPGWFAVVAAVRLVPYLVCSPVAGAIAGRYEPRRSSPSAAWRAVSSSSRCVIALRAGSAAGVLVLLLFALVAVGTPTFPALMRAVHHTVPPARLDRASTLAAGLESAAFCAGPAFGGLLLVVTGTTASLVVCAAMMLISAALAGFLPRIGGTTRPRSRLPEQPIRTAGRHLLLESRIRPAMAAVLGVNVLAGLDAALLVRLPAGLDLGGERAFGVLSFAQGAGAFGAFVALIGPIPRGRRPLVPLATAAVAVGVLAATSELSVAVIACCAFGASILTAEVVITGALGSYPAGLARRSCVRSARCLDGRGHDRRGRRRSPAHLVGWTATHARHRRHRNPVAGDLCAASTPASRPDRRRATGGKDGYRTQSRHGGAISGNPDAAARRCFVRSPRGPT